MQLTGRYIEPRRRRRRRSRIGSGTILTNNDIVIFLRFIYFVGSFAVPFDQSRCNVNTPREKNNWNRETIRRGRREREEV